MRPLALLIVLCAPALAPACPSDELVQALAAAPPARRANLTARALAQECERWPESLRKGVGILDTVDPDKRILIETQVINRHPRLWNAGCKGGLQAVIHASEVTPAERRTLLWKTCGPLDGLTEAEFARGEGFTYLPWLIQNQLKGHKAVILRSLVAPRADEPAKDEGKVGGSMTGNDLEGLLPTRKLDAKALETLMEEKPR